MEEREIRRGDIYHADLNPIFGSEQGGYRPVLIIQNNTGNKYSRQLLWRRLQVNRKQNYLLMYH